MELVTSIEQFEKIMDGDVIKDPEISDKKLAGILILSRFTQHLFASAEHDVIYFNVDLSDMIDSEITVDEVERLRNNGFHIDEHGGISTYV